MCGIVGYLGNRKATEVLVEGLSKLEYRGYDSAGVAVNTGEELSLRKFKGRLQVLADDLTANPINGGLGIGHTRWATPVSYTHLTERACIAGECEESAYYHIHSEYGYTELINSSGNESTKENELSEIVCTGFINPVMPFIRYKTKDIAINTLKKCNCGRNYKLIKKIEGRTQDFILDEFNNIITFTCNDEPLWGIKDKINSYQYIQAEKGKILLNINPKNHINTDEINRVKYEFESIFKNINLQIKIVDNIDREKNGKFKYLIQNLNISSISSISDSKN